MAVTLKFGKYMRECPYDGIDVYRVLTIFEVTDPAIQHAVKKLLCAGKRGGKDKATDIRETIVALERWEEMRREETIPHAQGCLCSKCKAQQRAINNPDHPTARELGLEGR